MVAKEMFKCVDSHGEGVLSYDEFKAGKYFQYIQKAVADSDSCCHNDILMIHVWNYRISEG